MRKLLVAFVIVFGWTAGAAAGQTSAAGTLADAFVDAWNTHDVRAFGRLYADDADWVTVAGERHKGRVAVEGVLAKEHAGWARTTILRATGVAVRAIDSENGDRDVQVGNHSNGGEWGDTTPRQYAPRGRKARWTLDHHCRTGCRCPSAQVSIGRTGEDPP
jgi:uncharacterized protein (TIGR02246 family)